jgi:hypothetical protein
MVMNGQNQHTWLYIDNNIKYARMHYAIIACQYVWTLITVHGNTYGSKQAGSPELLSKKNEKK